MTRTFLVECLWPGITDVAHADPTARARDAARTLRGNGHQTRFLGSVLVPADEVAFYRFGATSRGDVERASALADLPAERILEYLATPDAAVDQQHDPGKAAP